MKNLDIETVLWIEKLQVELERAKRQLEENTELMDAAKAEIEKLRKENEVLKREVGHLHWRLEKFEAEDAAAWEELSRKP